MLSVLYIGKQINTLIKKKKISIKLIKVIKPCKFILALTRTLL